MHRTPIFAAALVCLAISAPLAGAVDQVVNDSQGRPINFDVQAAGVDIAGYAGILDRAIHGDEISNMEVRVIPENRIAAECGSEAAACYRWSRGGGATLIVPSLPPGRVTAALVHEYGHHIDNSYEHLPNAPSLDGTANWWRARGMAQLLSSNTVAFDYGRGWDHSIAEIFAEDYKLLNAPTTGHMIRWLGAPKQPVLDAIRTDLGPGAPQPTTNPPNPGTSRPPPGSNPPAAASGRPAKGPLSRRARSRFNEKGRVRARTRRSIPFPVSSPRTIIVRAKVTNPRGRRALKAVLRCGGKTISTKRLRRGRPTTLVARKVNPGQCTVRLTAGRAPVRYALSVKKNRA